MDLDSMMRRENFFGLFLPTLQDYFKKVYDADITCDVSKPGQPANLVSYARLSAFTTKHMSSQARSFFYSEWNIRNNPIKNALAKIHVWIMTHSCGLLAKYRLLVSPDSIITRDIVIAPNNRTIRVFDYSNDIVGCIVKHGFTDKYFVNQLKFRLKYSYPFILPMKMWGDNWFIEPILYGHPLARVTDKRSYEQGVKNALRYIAILASDTLEYVETDVYVSDSISRIQNLVGIARDRKNIKTVDAITSLLNAITKATKHITSIPTCISHGDFQSGNIWVDRERKTWIYDWETAGRRSVWYDSSVIGYELRRVYGWDRLSVLKQPKMMLNSDPNKKRSDDDMYAIKYIVMMEDILFYLEDMLELPEDWGTDIFDAAVERLDVASAACSN